MSMQSDITVLQFVCHFHDLVERDPMLYFSPGYPWKTVKTPDLANKKNSTAP